MNTASLTLALALAVAAAGCDTVERTRETADPNTPARTLAWQVCSNCHGVTGNATSPNFPNLAGQTEPYLISQLAGFKSQNRSDPAGFEYMWGISRNLTDEQIKDLAAYYAGQKPVPVADASADPQQLSAGKTLFENGIPDRKIPACASCHGKEGQGNAVFPRLADQHADYLVKQLVVFQRTDERPEGSVMKTIAHDLTLDDMEAVAAYLQTIPVR